MNNEEWLPIPGLEGIADVSNIGNIRTHDRYCFSRDTKDGVARRFIPGRAVERRITRYGYAETNLRVDGVIHRFRVHRVVAKVFVPGEFEGAEVDHLDGDKLNNRADNLEWVTKAENVKRAWASGLNRGKRTKLNDLKEHAIQILYEHNFPPSVIAEWFGVSTSTAYQTGTGKLQSRRKPIPTD